MTFRLKDAGFRVHLNLGEGEYVHSSSKMLAQCHGMTSQCWSSWLMVGSGIQNKPVTWDGLGMNRWTVLIIPGSSFGWCIVNLSMFRYVLWENSNQQPPSSKRNNKLCGLSGHIWDSPSPWGLWFPWAPSPRFTWWTPSRWASRPMRAVTTWKPWRWRPCPQPRRCQGLMAGSCWKVWKNLRDFKRHGISEVLFGSKWTPDKEDRTNYR